MARQSKPPPRSSDDLSERASKITAPRPEVHLRRSNRRLTQEKDDKEESMTREIQGKILGIRPEGGDAMGQGEKSTKNVQKEGVQLAIEGLARMERRLMRATKRQKFKVEHSTLTDTSEVREETEHEPESVRETLLQNPEPVRPARAKGATRGSSESRDAEEEREAECVESDYADDDAGVKDIQEETLEIAERGAARPPAINSSFLPLPWKGRLGYACLNTYLRAAKQPVFSSRTCRIASILEHRHPLRDPSQPEHATKNRPDKSKEPSVELGAKFVQDLGLANARDIVKMLRWNDKYGIKFLRLSSEMFPFASHDEYGYKLAPFASEVLAEAGRVAAGLGHRLTTHPGQFTQLGSPRKQVIEASIRDLEYHDEMLSLLHLPEQQNRDAIMILHMGGTYGDKAATLDRFRANYKTLSASVKARLVLENDDVAWCVHDLLPICEELNIPLVLDYHHHNIIFDNNFVREGTFDISQSEISERITATWKRKGIKQKMHYSEPCAGAVTPRDRRKHSPRVKTLPPCPPDVDLMIEAKDKEQAVFELMRAFKLPGFEKINDMIPHERQDENRPAPEPTRKKGKGRGGKRKRPAGEDEDTVAADNGGAGEDETAGATEIAESDIGMGGPENRVYWPPGHEHWLKPMKRVTGKSNKVKEED
ncbi:hypothetical protein OQA88_5609 [Cercophora sp. LCS_1]